MSIAKMIASEIAALPPHLQEEVLDFVQFVKLRHGITKHPLSETTAVDSNDSPFFQALSNAGLVGCISTDEQLSTNYKRRIDFSAKIDARA
ncbi:MAG: hypothetical protein ORN28_02245 [Rhodoferax sp.]|nr:hypothetical protein [Rhodoferax sp.]